MFTKTELICFFVFILIFLALFASFCNATPIKINDNYYKIKINDDWIYIGDPDVFKPQALVTKWDEESSLKYSYMANTYNLPYVEDDKVKAKKVDSKTLEYYQMGTSDDFEFGIILEKKDSGNSFSFYLEGHENFNFLYQGEWETSEIIEGIEYSPDKTSWDNQVPESLMRPENVIGSYAVYHKTKYGGKYKTGKFCHIYRPKAIDKDGVEEWGTLSWDANSGVMTYSFNPTWLENAKYPIYIDPTIGTTSIGASSWTPTNNRIYAMVLGQLPVSSGTITDIRTYTGATGDKFAMAVYDDDGEPHLPIDATIELDSANNDWVIGASTQSGSVTLGATYYVGFWTPDSVTLKYDSDGAYDNLYKAETYPVTYSGFSDWVEFINDGVQTNRKVTIYFSYTEGGITPTPTLTVTQTQTNTVTATPTITITATPTVTCNAPDTTVRFGLNTNCDYAGGWEDTYVNELSKDTNYGTSEALTLLQNNGSDDMYIHFRVNVGDLPNYLDITSARVYFNVTNYKTVLAASPVLYELNRSFVELEDTFNVYSTGNSWTGNDGGNQDKGSAYNAGTSWFRGNVWHSIPLNAAGLTALESSAVNNTPVDFFMIDESIFGVNLDIASGNNVSAVARPYLEVCYHQILTPTPTQTNTVTATQTVTATPTITITPCTVSINQGGAVNMGKYSGCTPTNTLQFGSTGVGCFGTWVWSSNNEAVVTIDPVTGLATAVDLGFATIKVECSNNPSCFDTCIVTVINCITPTMTVTQTQTNTITATQTVTATPTVTPTFTVTQTQTVTVTATQTQTVTATMTVTATATITATNTATATITPTITLTPPIRGIDLKVFYDEYYDIKIVQNEYYDINIKYDEWIDIEIVIRGD